MCGHEHTADLELLGVSPDASLGAVTQAYHNMRALYASDSLATYSLVCDEDREAMLERIEAAHRRLKNRGFTPEEDPPGIVPDPPGGAAPVDPAVHPGKYFAQARRRKGLSLRDVADRTKIGVRHLQNIEGENFHDLPAEVYLKGFLVAYAQTLRLPDPRNAAGVYVEKYKRARSDLEE